MPLNVPMTKAKLHPGARWQFRVGGYVLFGFIGMFLLVILLKVFFALREIALGQTPVGLALALSFLSFIFIYIPLVIIVSEISARMSYNRWFYEFTDEGLRLERGIIWKRYSNVPYERIQNVDVSRGIIARLFGFSSVVIQTAGYSGVLSSEGYIPAVEMRQAEQIRAFLMKKITSRRK